MSFNPFQADAAVPQRLAQIVHERGDAIRSDVRAALGSGHRDPAENMGGVLPGAAAASIAAAHGIAPDELMLVCLEVAQGYARPPISDFHVGAVGREAGTGNLVFGGNLEFPGAHIGNTVHGEGFVFCRAFSRGTSIETLAIGEAHPCAHCRQFLSEFAATATLTLIDLLGHRLTMSQLYPWPFDPAYLGQVGILPGKDYAPGLDLPPAAAAHSALRAAGRRSYTPYGKAPAAVALALNDGPVATGSAIESVAFNPTLSPLQTAMIDLFAHGYRAADISGATIATVPGAPVDYVAATRGLLEAAAPGVPLTVVAWAG